MPYKVLEDGVTVHRTVNKLVQADGSVVHQNGMGTIHFVDEVIPDEEVAEDWREALESGEGALHDALSKKLEKVSDEPHEDLARRLGLPFEGYDEMEEDDVLAAMRTLPSPTVNAIREYESKRDDPRERIVDFNIGFGEGPMDRVEGRVGPQGDQPEPDEDKPVRKLTTREVSEDGDVELGEGVTGIGAPQVGHGEKKDEPLQTTAKRRGRRDRQTKPGGPAQPPPSNPGSPTT